LSNVVASRNNEKKKEDRKERRKRPAFDFSRKEKYERGEIVD